MTFFVYCIEKQRSPLAPHFQYGAERIPTLRIQGSNKMNQSKQYAYSVDCQRDEEHGERFGISQISNFQLTGLSDHWLTEDETRTELSSRGMSEDRIAIAIQLAKKKADSKP
jgi:hypothetical protein